MSKRRLLEFARRRAAFDPEYCTPIVLCNGEAWQFKKPWLEIVPIFRGGEVVDYSRMLTCGILDPLVEEIGKQEPGIEQAMMILSLGALILLRSYDLTDDELSRLFVLRPGDAASQKLLRDIIEVATGNTLSAVGGQAILDPKQSDGGYVPA